MNRKPRNRAIAAMALAMLLAMCAGCSSGPIVVDPTSAPTADPATGTDGAAPDAGASAAPEVPAAPADRVRIDILTKGWVNTPTDENDPFKKYIDAKYNADVYLTATADFETQIAVKFASDAPPDIVSFNALTDFNKQYAQGTLLEDWTPYLANMPNFQKVMAATQDTQKVLGDEGKLKAVWTVPAGTTWSFKIRKDWLDALGLKPPTTEDELLEVARAFAQKDPDGNGKADTYAFSDGCAGNGINIVDDWTALVYGDRWYIKDGKVTNGFFDGTHKQSLDLIKTFVSEGLMDPNWFVQDWGQSETNVLTGKIGMHWYPGIVVTNSEANNGNDGSTLGWWDVIPVPKSDRGNEYAGFMGSPGLLSEIITAGAKASLDANKMAVIARIIDDVMMTPDGKRPETYDALRWGIGVEPGHEYIPIPDTDLVYANTADKSFYWDKQPGSWDWGQWFSIPQTDGVVQGNTAELSDAAVLAAKFDAFSADLPSKPSLNMLTLDPEINTKLNKFSSEFEYLYVTGQETDFETYVQDWRDMGGDKLMQQAEEQLKGFGMIP